MDDVTFLRELTNDMADSNTEQINHRALLVLIEDEISKTYSYFIPTLYDIHSAPDFDEARKKAIMLKSNLTGSANLVIVAKVIEVH